MTMENPQSRMVEMPDGSIVEKVVETEEIKSLGAVAPGDSDGLSDLFEVTEGDVMGEPDEDMDDLTQVDVADVMGDEDGDISDLTQVSDEDIIGTRLGTPSNRMPTRRRIIRREAPQPSMGSMEL